MMRGLALAVLLFGCSVQQAPDDTRSAVGPRQMTVAPVTLKASDGLTVYGRYYRTTRPKALILLFHQAGSSMDEYATITPKLAAAGYSALAIDQRSGGRLFGPNRTAVQLKRDPGYAAAQRDMQASVDWGAMQNLPLVIWGSSYSSALAFPLAAENADRVRAVLAFSPGEYLDNKTAVARAAKKLAMPVFLAVADGGAEAAAAKPIATALAGDKIFYISEHGVHGSSTLIEAKNPQGAAANWQAVEAFLRRAVS